MHSNDLTPEVTLSLLPEKTRAAVRAEFVKHGAMKDGMSPSEAADLEQFKLELADRNVTERQTMIAGGEAAIAQKARVSESWLANNIHNTK